MNAKSKTTKSDTNGMQGEDFAYSGAGPASDAKKPAVVAGEVKKTSNTASAKTPAKGNAEETKWGKRSQGQQFPGGLAEAEEAGERSKKANG